LPIINYGSIVSTAHGTYIGIGIATNATSGAIAGQDNPGIAIAIC